MIIISEAMVRYGFLLLGIQWHTSVGHRPTPEEFVELVRRGEITESVLYMGCGMGEHALFFAGEGYKVWGIDFSPWRSRRQRRRLQEEDSGFNFLS